MSAEQDNFPSNSKIPRSEIEAAEHHLFLCVGPECCDPTANAHLWDLLKSETKKLPVKVLRTKAACLRVCHEGPWLVIYPEGIWYGQVNAERLRRILQEHIVEKRPVTEWIAARMPHLKNSD